MSRRILCQQMFVWHTARMNKNAADIPMTPFLPALAIAGTVITWSFSFAAIGYALREVEPLPLAAIRFALAAVFAIAWIAWRRPRCFLPPGFRRSGDQRPPWHCRVQRAPQFRAGNRLRRRCRLHRQHTAAFHGAARGALLERAFRSLELGWNDSWLFRSGPDRLGAARGGCRSGRDRR